MMKAYVSLSSATGCWLSIRESAVKSCKLFLLWGIFAVLTVFDLRHPSEENYLNWSVLHLNRMHIIYHLIAGQQLAKYKWQLIDILMGNK